jgi:DNA-binding response OmpR family regulator
MRRVLLVEHQRPLRESLESILRDAGYDTDSVGTLAEARAKFDAADYDLVLANDRLPDGRGYDVAAAAEALGIKSFLVSGGADEVTLTPAGKPHLRQKFQVAELTETLAHLADSD